MKHAVVRSHKVSIFTRGRADDSMLPDEVERLVGDRNGQLGALEGKKRAAVFDAYPSTVAAIGLATNYALESTSSYRSKGLDGRDPGADIAELARRTASAVVAP